VYLVRVRVRVGVGVRVRVWVRVGVGARIRVSVEAVHQRHGSAQQSGDDDGHHTCLGVALGVRVLGRGKRSGHHAVWRGIV
jgi:hypothetical protein